MFPEPTLMIIKEERKKKCSSTKEGSGGRHRKGKKGYDAPVHIYV